MKHEPEADRTQPFWRRTSELGRCRYAFKIALIGALGCAGSERQPQHGWRLTQSSVETKRTASSGEPSNEGTSPPPFARPDPGPSANRVEHADLVTDYPLGSIHSPITPRIAAHLRDLVAEMPGLHADRFFKVGDSISASRKFLACFSEMNAVVPGAERTLEALRATKVGVFDRESVSAEDGWSAWQPLAGTQPPLLRELADIQGRFALVMLGTNDIETSRVTTFARRFIRLVDALWSRGVVPIVSTIPERRDRQASRLKVPRFNAVIRAVAQHRRIPLLDLHWALSMLPNEGLAKDGIHPSVYRVGGLSRPCDFSKAGLEHGFNVRNLRSIEALHRARGALDGSLELDAESPARTGNRLAIPLGPPGLPVLDVAELLELPTAGACPSGSVPEAARLPLKTLDYHFGVTQAGPIEVLAISAKGGERLFIGIEADERPGECLVSGKGFKRVRLASGGYSLSVQGTAGDALVLLLRGRGGAS